MSQIFNREDWAEGYKDGRENAAEAIRKITKKELLETFYSRESPYGDASSGLEAVRNMLAEIASKFELD